MLHTIRVALAAGVLSVAAFASSAQADSYINSQNPLPQQRGAYAQGAQVAPAYRVAPRPRPRVQVSPAASPQQGTNFGVLVRDTRGEGYGPNGR